MNHLQWRTKVRRCPASVIGDTGSVNRMIKRGEHVAAGVDQQGFIHRNLSVPHELLNGIGLIVYRKAIDQGCAGIVQADDVNLRTRSEEHTSELQSLMRISYAVFCLKKKKKTTT